MYIHVEFKIHEINSISWSQESKRTTRGLGSNYVSLFFRILLLAIFPRQYNGKGMLIA